MSLDQWSTTPASNDIANYFQTGMRPSSVKTAGWDIMADLAQLLNALPAGGGTASAMTVTNPRALGSLSTGLVDIFKPSVANTGGVTFSPDGLTGKQVRTIKGSGVDNLLGGEIQIGMPTILKYDGTQWLLLNPAWTSAYFSSSNVPGGTNSITSPAAGWAGPIPTSLIDGAMYVFKINNTTTAAPTLNINSLGAKNIYYSDGVTRLAAGSLIANNEYQFIYDSSLNASAGGFICANPSRVTGSATVTVTGHASDPTGTMNYAIEPSGLYAEVWFASAISGTSNSVSMTITGVPSVIQPITSKKIIIVVQDASANTIANITVSASSTWTLGNNAQSANGFTNSSTSKGMTAGTYFSFPLD